VDQDDRWPGPEAVVDEAAQHAEQMAEERDKLMAS
jgi:hypothetical protein